MPLPEFMQPKEQKAPTIHGFSASITVLCSCGSPAPLQLSFILGMNLKTTCQACQGELWLAIVLYNSEQPTEIRLGVAYEPKRIIQAPAALAGLVNGSRKSY